MADNRNTEQTMLEEPQRRVFLRSAILMGATAFVAADNGVTAAQHTGKAKTTVPKQLGKGQLSAAKREEINATAKRLLDSSSRLNASQVQSVMAVVHRTLPQLGVLSTGHLVIGVSQHTGGGLQVQQCTGGHLCDGQDSTPGDGPDCRTEACDTQICEDHLCENQSCSAEACSGHDCTGTYKGFIDVSAMSASSQSAWKSLQQKIDQLQSAGKLEVSVSAPR